MSWADEAQRAWHDRTRDELARAWIAGIVERTPLEDLGGLDLGWLGREAPRLVGELLAELNSPAPQGTSDLPEPAADRARALIKLRRSQGAPEVPRDLADLQRLIGEALARNGGAGDAVERSGRLALLFGELQSAFVDGLLGERSERQGLDPVTGLADEGALRAELDRLIDAAATGGLTFSLLELDLDGLRRINTAHGERAGDRLLEAIADALSAVVGVPGRVFRRSDDELAAIVEIPDLEAIEIASRLRESLGLLEAEHGIPVSVSIGVASWPAHAAGGADLLERVREATYLAKASGEGVAIPDNSLLQRP
ncbi:MAG: diguanylate cyclase domain-containing protein [Solirubrobacterales bacterium]